MENIPTDVDLNTISFRHDLKERSDKLMDYFLLFFLVIGLIFANFYNTWFIAVGVGGCCLLAYYFAKAAMPASNLYQYILSIVLGIFMAQYIYQMHGMFEMHFFAFIGSAILITYQNWKLQIPLMLFVLIHHATLGYLQNAGVPGIYFTQLNSLELQTFMIHIQLAGIIFFICGLWAYQLDKYSRLQVSQLQEMARLEREAQVHKERIINEEALQIAWLNAEKARQEADDANKAKSVFLATMSHEIRTPMNGVIGMASLLGETELTLEQQEFTKTITTCGEALLTVINDILDFSKIESGNMDLDEHDFDLRNCIEDVLDIFANKIGSTGLELIYEIDEMVPYRIIGDSFRLRQVLVNLVSNAIKFTEEGEIFIGVSLQEKTGDHIILQFKVRDTGIGVPEDKLQKLFKAFSQVDSSTTRKYGGTGLGLIICEKLVKLMGGDIGMESEQGKGSCVHFTILTQIALSTNNSVNVLSPANLEGKRALVIDDNPTNRSILEKQLKRWKIIPTMASGGAEAIGLLLKETAFDMVLSDMQMPRMDGAELATRIKQIQPGLPIILLSSIGDERTKNNRLLFKSVLTKPVRQLTLCKELCALFEKDKPMVARETQQVAPVFAEEYPLQLLLVEDNKINQQVAIRILSKLGYTADVAVNGQQAVEMAAAGNYDLILMDVQMPVMDGLEATRIIRKENTTQATIIAMTANAMLEDKNDCLEAGMDDFISKPVKLEELINMLRKWAFITKEIVQTKNMAESVDSFTAPLTSP